MLLPALNKVNGMAQEDLARNVNATVLNFLSDEKTFKSLAKMIENEPTGDFPAFVGDTIAKISERAFIQGKEQGKDLSQGMAFAPSGMLPMLIDNIFSIGQELGKAEDDDEAKTKAYLHAVKKLTGSQHLSEGANALASAFQEGALGDEQAKQGMLGGESTAMSPANPEMTVDRPAGLDEDPEGLLGKALSRLMA